VRLTARQLKSLQGWSYYIHIINRPPKKRNLYLICYLFFQKVNQSNGSFYGMALFTYKVPKGEQFYCLTVLLSSEKEEEEDNKL
jgi:hypothetical protein